MLIALGLTRQALLTYIPKTVCEDFLVGGRAERIDIEMPIFFNI